MKHCNSRPELGEIRRIRKEYPEGARVELVKMNDPYVRLPEGLQGTVWHVDDLGTVFVDWDNGSHLGVVLGEDVIKKI